MSVRERIEECLRDTKMSETRFGRCAINDPRLLGDLRRGRRLTDPTVARIEAFMADLRS